MNKEELIALSDLNREDNIKYISSEAQGIAINLNSDRYAPTLCKLERAYICGRRKSEEQIEQLKKENAELKEELNYAKTHCLFHSDCPNQKELASIKLKVDALSGDIPWNELKDKSEVIGKLTKAKEIIKNLMEFAEIDCREYEEAYKEAEQFVKE